MAPTCYNNMKNLHYRTQSLPESVYQHQMLHLTQPHPHGDQFHHGHHHLLGGPQHQASHIKKRNALRRSQTSVCDLFQSGLTHHRAPLTAGLYEQFLPPPNFNAIGLPVQSNRVARSRTQSFYVPSSHSQHYRSAMSRLNMNSGSVANSHLDIHSGHTTSPYSYPVCDQSSSWYHRSVPNISTTSYPAASSKSVTTPLFVDCSVEYDLGDQPVIPADSEPLLSIHPDYIAKTRSVPSSPYDKHNRPRLESHHRGSNDSLPADVDKTRMMEMRPSCGRVARSIRPSPRAAMARSNLSSKLDATRKLSCESRDSGIGMMNSAGALNNQWPLMYNTSGCDMSNLAPMTPFTTSTTTPGHYSQQQPVQLTADHHQTDYMGKVLPSASKRFALSGMNSGMNNNTVAAKHYQNLRVYYQLAF